MTDARILVLNAGSSSLKASLIEQPAGRTLARAGADWGADASRASGRSDAIATILVELGLGPDRADRRVDAVGYRVVHGGSRFTAPALIDDDVLAGIRDVRELAPLHNEVAIDTIEVGRRLLPGIPHVACFDTSFHASLAPEAFRYALPERWYTDWGIRRYGFHGLSVAWSTRRAAALLDRDVRSLSLVVAHLGSGCSVTAVAGGRSVDTSMGLTPLEGLMMGTRSGSVDPGALLRVLQDGRLSADEAADVLDHESGLMGVSGIGSDVRAIGAAADEGDGRARLAIDMFVRRAAGAIGAAATTISVLDGIVFTGGIGEHAVAVRDAVVARLGVLGVDPLPAVSASGDGRLDAGGSVPVLRIEAREDLVVAAEAAACLGPAQGLRR